MLLEKGADANMQGVQYGNALQAASFSGYTKVAKMLLVKGAHVNLQGGLSGQGGEEVYGVRRMGSTDRNITTFEYRFTEWVYPIVRGLVGRRVKAHATER